MIEQLCILKNLQSKSVYFVIPLFHISCFLESPVERAIFSVKTSLHNEMPANIIILQCVCTYVLSLLASVKPI